MRSRTGDGTPTSCPSRPCCRSQTVTQNIWETFLSLNHSASVFVTHKIVSQNRGQRLTTYLDSFDRYRPGLKGTWKDQALPAAGVLYDLGTHLIDQAYALFGRPQTVTATLENLRGIGDPSVDDYVRNWIFVACICRSNSTFTSSLLCNCLTSEGPLVSTH